MLNAKTTAWVAIAALLIGAFLLAKQQGWIGTKAAATTTTTTP